jgi:hypothetical protein
LRLLKLLRSFFIAAAKTSYTAETLYAMPPKFGWNIFNYGKIMERQNFLSPKIYCGRRRPCRLKFTRFDPKGRKGKALPEGRRAGFARPPPAFIRLNFFKNS